MVALDRHLRISRDDMLQTQFDASRELIRGLAHEIKNPLGGIRGAAQLMEHEFPASQHRERSEEHTSELQSLMCITYAVFCLNTKTYQTITHHLSHIQTTKYDTTR